MSQATQHRYQLWGWILFIVSAIFFMAASINAGDPISLVGGAFFLIACFVFLAPLLAQLLQASENDDASNLLQLRKCFQYRPGWFRAVNWRSRVPGVTSRQPVPAHLQEQSRRHSIRSELRFFASIR
jgi:hypothetical protein